MRIVITECSVLYSGRGDTTMGSAIRSIMIKNDGSVSVHNDVSNKPLNYMGKGNVWTKTIDENSGKTIWRFDSRKEYLEITLYRIIAEFEQELDKGDVPLVRDGTEYDLQAWLFENHNVIRSDLIPVRREHDTSAGAIDLLFQSSVNNAFLGVEVKRVAMLGAVDQCVRYQNALSEQFGDDVEVLLVALDVRPNTAKQAAKRGIPYQLVPQDWRNFNNIQQDFNNEQNSNNEDESFSENSLF